MKVPMWASKTDFRGGYVLFWESPDQDEPEPNKTLIERGKSGYNG